MVLYSFNHIYLITNFVYVYFENSTLAITQMMHEIFRVMKPGGRFITFSLHSAESILQHFQDFNVDNKKNVLYQQQIKTNDSKYL